jgi:hypothetical protein
MLCGKIPGLCRRAATSRTKTPALLNCWREIPGFCCRAPGGPAYGCYSIGLRSRSLALLTQRGRTLQLSCHWQLCCLACNGTTRAKASAFNVRRSYFGPKIPQEGSKWWSRRASHPGPIRLSPRVYRHSPGKPEHARYRSLRAQSQSGDALVPETHPKKYRTGLGGEQ